MHCRSYTLLKSRKFKPQNCTKEICSAQIHSLSAWVAGQWTNCLGQIVSNVQVSYQSYLLFLLVLICRLSSSRIQLRCYEVALPWRLRSYHLRSFYRFHNGFLYQILLSILEREPEIDSTHWMLSKTHKRMLWTGGELEDNRRTLNFWTFLDLSVSSTL